MKRPECLYPTLINGRIDGPIRCQSIDGSEMWLPAQSGKITMPPFEHGGKMWCVSHLQKKAKFFSLLYDPFIYHFGSFWKLQEYSENPDGGSSWKPGTEQGIYWRTWGWRWQLPDEKSGGTPWIFSWGRMIGMHLD